MSDNRDFKTKAIIRDKEGYYIMTKGTIQQKDIILVNLCVPNKGTPKYVKQILMDIKGAIDRTTVIVRDVNTPLNSMERSSRQKINKRAALNNTLDQVDLINIFRAFHSKTAEYTYFSSTHGTFSMIDYML